MKFPETAAALVEELDRLFPERVPEIGDSMEAIQRYAGRRELILFLKNWQGKFGRDVDRRQKGRR